MCQGEGLQDSSAGMTPDVLAELRIGQQCGKCGAEAMDIAGVN